LDPRQFETAPLPGATYSNLPGFATNPDHYREWRTTFQRWIRHNRPLALFHSKHCGLHSRPGESEAEFRARVAQAAREVRDLEIAKLRGKYRTKFETLQNRLLRAQQALEREEEQAKAHKAETFVSFGTAILGAFLGRKRLSSTSASRVGRAVKSAGRIRKEEMDVARARETVESVQQQMTDLDGRLQAEIDHLDISLDPSLEALEEIRITPKRTDIALRLFGLAWLPFRRDAHGRLIEDWTS
jgi:hypothetical protein